MCGVRGWVWPSSIHSFCRDNHSPFLQAVMPIFIITLSVHIYMYITLNTLCIHRYVHIGISILWMGLWIGDHYC